MISTSTGMFYLTTMRNLLDSLNIIQHGHVPTHIDGHTIDLILTPSVIVNKHQLNLQISTMWHWPNLVKTIHYYRYVVLLIVHLYNESQSFSITVWTHQFKCIVKYTKHSVQRLRGQSNKPSLTTASEINQCGSDNRRRWSCHDLATRFPTFFLAKIGTIHVAYHTYFTLTSTSTTDHHHPTFCVSWLQSLLTATTSDNLLNKSPTTSCMIDLLPTWLLKDVIHNLVPFLAQLINSLIVSGVVPCCLKHGNVTPVLKKANLACGIPVVSWL